MNRKHPSFVHSLFALALLALAVAAWLHHLRGVDEAGRAVRFSWPSDVDVHDARLQRISEADPGAWWGSTRRQVVWL